MKIFVLSILVMLSFLATPVLAATPDKDLRVAVEKLAALVSDGYAQLYAEQLASVSSNSSHSVAVFFTLEGPRKGNGSWQFLAFFEHNEAIASDEPPSSSYRLVAFRQVGSRGTRFFEPGTASFHNGVLAVSGMAMGPRDAMCCPSVPVRSVFKVQDGAVVEQRSGS